MKNDYIPFFCIIISILLATLIIGVCCFHTALEDVVNNSFLRQELHEYNTDVIIKQMGQDNQEKLSLIINNFKKGCNVSCGVKK